MNNALEIKNLNVTLDKFKLNNINLTIEKGTIHGLIGKNGAGKTTLINSIMNCIKRDSGSILYDGLNYYENELQVKLKTGCVFDHNKFNEYMTPDKIVNILSPFYPEFNFNLYNNYMDKFNLDRKKRLIKYSTGMQKKFNCIITIACNPDLLILDEPTSSLDPAARREMLDLFLDYMQNESKSILFSTHITSDLDKIADYISLIDEGNIIFSKEINSLQDDYAIATIPKEAMTDELKNKFISIIENSFSYEGLINTKLHTLDTSIKCIIPTIEELMVLLTSNNKHTKEN